MLIVLDPTAGMVPNPKTKQPYVSIFCSWNTARKEAGMPELRMHDLRHSFASFLINSNHMRGDPKCFVQPVGTIARHSAPCNDYRS